MAARTVAIDQPLELRLTLRPLTFPWGRWSDDGWWRPARTPEGPATLHIRRGGEQVTAEAWGAGADWVLSRVESWIGLDDDPSSFRPDHPLVLSLHRRHRGARFARTGLVFEALVVAVMTQKVTGKEAARGLAGLARRFSDPAPGPVPGLRLPPDPARLADAPYHLFHDLGVERRRADILRRVAAEAGRIDGLAGSTADEARRFLQRFAGVGVWTSAETVAISHGDPDAVSVGDFHHRHLVAWHLGGEARGTDERMLELLEPFKPHRGRVVRLLEAAGRYPAHGPRKPIRSFAAF